MGNSHQSSTGPMSTLFVYCLEQGEEVNSSEARIGMWVSVSLTGQIVGITPEKIVIRTHGLKNSEVPVESAEVLSQSETLANE